MIGIWLKTALLATSSDRARRRRALSAAAAATAGVHDAPIYVEKGLLKYFLLHVKLCLS
jgi:hypothetical protein